MTRLHGGGPEAGGAAHERAHELGQEALGVRPAVPAAAQPSLWPPPTPRVMNSCFYYLTYVRA